MKKIIFLNEADAATERYQRALKMAAKARTPEEKAKYEAEAQKWNTLAGKANQVKQGNVDASKWTAQERLDQAKEVNAQRKDANSKIQNYYHVDKGVRNSVPKGKYIPQKGVDAVNASRETANKATENLLNTTANARAIKTGTKPTAVSADDAKMRVYGMTHPSGINRQGTNQIKQGDVLSDEKKGHRVNQRIATNTREITGSSNAHADNEAFKTRLAKAGEKTKTQSARRDFYNYLGTQSNPLSHRNKYFSGNYGEDYQKLGASGNTLRGHAKNQTP